MNTARLFTDEQHNDNSSVTSTTSIKSSISSNEEGDKNLKSPSRRQTQEQNNSHNIIENKQALYQNCNNDLILSTMIKVIKGEIHNVLSVMRADPRYASPKRFDYDIPDISSLTISTSSSNTIGGVNVSNSSVMKKETNKNSRGKGYNVVHPLIWSLRDLSTKLSYAESSQSKSNNIVISSTNIHHSAEQIFDIVTYLTPFCTAIVSREISANVTGTALSSLHKFLLYGFLTSSLPRAKDGITLIARSIRHCTFEEVDEIGKGHAAAVRVLTKRSNNTSLLHSKKSQNKQEQHRATTVSSSSSSSSGSAILFYNDEEVVLKLLSLAALVIRCDAGMTLLEPHDIVGIFETCLHVACFASHASRLLQSAAGDSLAHIILAVFSKIDESLVMDDLLTTTSSTTVPTTPATVAIMTKLVELIDPTHVPESICILSLSWINIALETGSTSLSSYPAMLSLLQNDLCKHLLRLSTTSDLVILQQTLRVIFNLFNSLKNHLKIQLEVFLQSVYFRILQLPSSPEKKELVLESLLEFCHEPALLHDLYINYDCDYDCSNLFEMICIVLCSQAYKGYDKDNQNNTSLTFNVLNQLALEGLLVVIDSIARRCAISHQKQVNLTSVPSNLDDSITSSASDTSSEANNNQYHPVLLQERKRRKHLLKVAAQEFNSIKSDKEWITILERLQVLPSPATPKSVAQFFFNSYMNLDKTKIGIYISKGPKEKYPFHSSVLVEYCNLFDFLGCSFDDALRMFLGRFRLPGEAQCIDRLMEAFATRLYQQQNIQIEIHDEFSTERENKNPLKEPGNEDNINSAIESKNSSQQSTTPNITHPFRNSDAVYILAFSTIMLNTDLHNPNLPDERRMTCDQFLNNNRGINDGQDLPRDFLTNLYHNILNEEIKVEKHQELEVSDALYALSHQNGEAIIQDQEKHDVVLDHIFEATKNSNFPTHVSNSSFTQSKEDGILLGGIHERDMFECMSAPALSCLSQIFLQTMDDVIVVKALIGLQQMAKISIYFQLDKILNDVVKQLLKYGRNYVESFIMMSLKLKNQENENDEEEYEDEDDEALIENYVSFLEKNPVPNKLLFHKGNNLLFCPPAFGSAASYIDQNSPNYYYHFSKDIVQGSATHRGLLSLHCALSLIKAFVYNIREAWTDLIQCLFQLRDATVLNVYVGLSDLDDFADSKGIVLPCSKFELINRKYVLDYYIHGIVGRDDDFADEDDDDGGDVENQPTFWNNIFGNSEKEENYNAFEKDSTMEEDLSFLKMQSLPLLSNLTQHNDEESNPLYPIKDALKKISKSAQLESILLSGGAIISSASSSGMSTSINNSNMNRSKDQIIRSLLDFTTSRANESDDSNSEDIGIFQHHAAWALELAARSLLTANPTKIVELYPMFHSKLSDILSSKDAKNTKSYYYLMERATVTILRACIHLYDIPEMRVHLESSLSLIPCLPVTLVTEISDRLGCGTAIVLRSSFYHIPDNKKSWSLIHDLLDLSARHPKGRGFVFDGIASTIEFATSSENSYIIPVEGCVVLCSLMCNFLSGLYDFPSSIFLSSSTICEHVMIGLERVFYSLCRQVLFAEKGLHNINFTKVEEVWKKIVLTLYTCCYCNRSSVTIPNGAREIEELELVIAKQGFQILSQILLTTIPMDKISDSAWLDILQTFVVAQLDTGDTLCNSELVTVTIRMKSFELISRILLLLLPQLTQNIANVPTLESIIQNFVNVIQWNRGQNGLSNDSLSEGTTQLVMNMSNVLLMQEKGGISENFGKILMTSLEQQSSHESIEENTGSSENGNDTKSMERDN